VISDERLNGLAEEVVLLPEIEPGHGCVPRSG
jgi:hypothetical protein